MSALFRGVCFADFGHDVVCCRTRRRQDLGVKKGQIPSSNPGWTISSPATSRPAPEFQHDDSRPPWPPATSFSLPSERRRGAGDGHAIFLCLRSCSGNRLPTFRLYRRGDKSTVPVGTETRSAHHPRNQTLGYVTSSPTGISCGKAPRSRISNGPTGLMGSTAVTVARESDDGGLSAALSQPVAAGIHDTPQRRN